MPKTRRRKKTSPKSKEKSVAAEYSSEFKIPEAAISEPPFQRNSILLRLAGNPHFVGAMRWMLRGCLACGVFFAVLFGVPGLGRLFEKLTYQIASLAPKNFIPPDTYVPGELTPPILLLMIAGFTIFGYREGSAPPQIVPGEDERAFKEKLFELIFFLAVCLLLVFYRFRSDYPDLSFIEIISYPFFIILVAVITLGIFYYVFSRHQSPQLLIFVMSSALAVAFVLFLMGLVAYSLFKSFTYALSH